MSAGMSGDEAGDAAPSPASEGVEPPSSDVGEDAAAAPAATVVHASAVAVPGPDGAPRAALILGRSGAGKSTLALDLIARGARLIADDRTIVRRSGDRLIAACPPPLAGLIEARGIGLIRVPPLAEAEIALIIDLDATEPDRLPPPRSAVLLGVTLPRILRPASPDGALAAAIYVMLRHHGAPEPT
jgi:HPr kinase/phosphorylase